MSGLVKKVLSKTGKYLGLGGVVALQTPIHEGIHCTTQRVLGGGCSKIHLSEKAWYTSPLEFLSGGFIEGAEIGGGVAYLSHANDVLGKLSNIVATGAPEYIYTALGVGLVSHGTSIWNKKPVLGMAETAAGGLCFSNTLYYMKMCLSGAQPGHDYYNVTQTVFELMHLPGDCASWATPLVGIPLLFGAAYFTAGMFMSGINKLKKTENENGHPNGVE